MSTVQSAIFIPHMSQPPMFIKHSLFRSRLPTEGFARMCAKGGFTLRGDGFDIAASLFQQAAAHEQPGAVKIHMPAYRIGNVIMKHEAPSLRPIIAKSAIRRKSHTARHGLQPIGLACKYTHERKNIDPAKRNSANLMAGVAGAGFLGAAKCGDPILNSANRCANAGMPSAFAPSGR